MRRMLRAVAVAALLLAGCGADEESDDPRQPAELAAECTPQVRFEGTVYWGLIGPAKHVPTGSQIGVADVADCDDIGRNPIGPYFPPDPDQVEVWALEGYPISEVIGVQRHDGVDVYAVEDMPRTRADAITNEMLGSESNSPDIPRLLTWHEGPTDRPGMDALVGGVLRVNEAGCFALDRWILVAPPGSTVSLDGRSIVIPRLGHFSIGDTVRGGGGETEGTNDVLDAACVPGNAPPLFLVLNQ